MGGLFREQLQKKKDLGREVGRGTGSWVSSECATGGDKVVTDDKNEE